MAFWMIVALAGALAGVAGFLRAGTALRDAAVLRQALDVVVRRQIELAQAMERLGHGVAVAPVVEPVAEEMAPVEVAAVEGVVAEGVRGSVPVVEFQGGDLPEGGVAAAPARAKIDIETLLTQRWGVWVGSVALLFAGVFLVRYAVEQGWLGPAVRCLAGFVLGGALLAGAEWLVRHPGPAIAGPFGVDQAPAGLAAGGAAVLFGAAYGVGVFYELVPPFVGFVLMGGVALVGLGAALRFGPLTAAVGVACAFITPALVDSDNPSLMSLFAYLLVVTAACWAVVRATAWVWLGWAATAGGVAWVVLIGSMGPEETVGPALYVVLAAGLNLALLPGAALEHEVGRRLAWVPFGALVAAGVVLEWMVPGIAPRGAVFALTGLAVAKGMVEPRLDRLPWIAGLGGVLVLAIWALPAWGPTGEAIRVEGVVQAFFPGGWAPGALEPVLITALGFAGVHAAAGLWFERRMERPLAWSALPAAVPFLVLVVVYGHVGRVWPDVVWAGLALGLAGGLIFTARLALAGAGRQVAGVHGAGAVAALVLGLCFRLHDHWLTLAFSLMLPGLAWIEDRAGLPQLRPVALAVAGMVLARLLLNWQVLGYALGGWPVVNGLVAAYAVPALAFGVAALMFARGRDDLLVRTLESGAVLLGAGFVVLEIRHAVTGGTVRFGDPGFGEVAADVLGLAVQAWGYRVAAERTERAVLGVAWRGLGVLALIGAGLLLVGNPAFSGERAGAGAVLCAYVLPAAIAAAMAGGVGGRAGTLLRVYAVVAGFVWIWVQIRILFHPDRPGLWRGVEDAELWCWSGGWLAYGIALLAGGVWRQVRGMRLAGLAIVGFVSLKVFLVDMGGLVGLWRVVSFLGLGLALIGLGAVYRRFGVGIERSGGSVDHPL